MSKTKENLLRQQEMQQEYYNWFMEFVYTNLVDQRLSEKDIDTLEEQTAICSTNDKYKRSVSDFPFHFANNTNYNKPIGA